MAYASDIIASGEVIMRTVIVSLNSKFIHSSLAPWYLKAACRQYAPDCGDVIVSEHTINENMDSVLSSIYLLRPDITAFSCYIWNISQVLELASNLKKLLPGSVIILGGPEVSYDAGEILRDNPFIDFIIAGEGERSFPKLVSMIHRSAGLSDTEKFINGDAADIDGLVFRSGDGIIENGPAVIKDLDDIPSPYTDEMLSSLKNRIAYFEASRGCPFSCSYCLSSANEGVRFFSLQRIFDDLDKLVRSGVNQIKFVDRTFNAGPGRSKEIIRHILRLNDELKGGDGAICNFHFEVGADLFDDEWMELLDSAPKGLIQLEAGVQSTNREALAAVCRKTDIDKLLLNIRKIRSAGNVHIHADLIAGLPYEDQASFGRSFDDVYSARPHQLQLGFLKLLKGTRLRAQAGGLGYTYREQPPYEILSSGSVCYDELISLKGIAEVLERYYNSGRFYFSLDHIIERHFRSPFDFYESFCRYLADNGLSDNPVALRDQYRIVDDFYKTITCDKQDRLLFEELLRLDFLSYDSSGTLPGFMERRQTTGLREKCFDFLRGSDLVGSILPEADGMKPKQILKHVYFEPMFISPAVCPDEREISHRSFGLVKEPVIFIFNYFSRDKVTDRFKFHALEI